MGDVGRGINVGNAGVGCGPGVNAVNCGNDQRTDVNEIPHGLDNAQEAVHFGSSLTSGCAEGQTCGGAPPACTGNACGAGGAFGKSKVETPSEKDKASKGNDKEAKVSGKEQTAEKKEAIEEKQEKDKPKSDEKQAKKH